MEDSITKIKNEYIKLLREYHAYEASCIKEIYNDFPSITNEFDLKERLRSLKVDCAKKLEEIDRLFDMVK